MDYLKVKVLEFEGKVRQDRVGNYYISFNDNSFLHVEICRKISDRVSFEEVRKNFNTYFGAFPPVKTLKELTEMVNYINNYNTMKQYLTRKQLLSLRDKSDCQEWKSEINDLLKKQYDTDKIDISSKLEKLVQKGTEEQKKLITDLKISLPETYENLQAKWIKDNDIKVGDIVKVLRPFTEVEREKYFHEFYWTSFCQNKVGKNCEIIDILEDRIRISDGLHNSFPYYVLQKVEKKIVPFSFEDDLLGEIIISKQDNSKGLITHQGKKNITFNNKLYTYEELMNFFIFPNNKFCGKKVYE